MFVASKKYLYFLFYFYFVLFFYYYKFIDKDMKKQRDQDLVI